MLSRIPVAVLGATGVVGQRMVQLLDGHPWFEPVTLAASERTAGHRYGDACRWLLESPMPAWAAGMVVRDAREPMPAQLVLSALSAGVAGPIESACARRGQLVVTNARDHRLAPDVPLLVPEVNAAHLCLLARQRGRHGGAIVANPHCSTATLMLALAPLERAFGLEAVQVTTLQAVSGAGYPGAPALDVLGNVVPFIEGEEEKIAAESRKILGAPGGPHPLRVVATATRVPVPDGHTLVVTATLAQGATVAEVREALVTFTGAPQQAALPTAPARPVVVRDERDRPQPRLDVMTERGMATVVGRLRMDDERTVRLVALGHNTIRGAAGGALLAAELAISVDRGPWTELVVSQCPTLERSL